MAPSTNYDRGWKNKYTCSVQNHMIGAAPPPPVSPPHSFSGCYFLITGDKAYLQCKHKVSFDKPAILFHGKKRRPARLSGLNTSSQPHVSQADVSPIVLCPAKSCSWGVTFLSLPCPYITLASCQGWGGHEVCVQEVAFQSPSYGDMWKGNGSDFRPWTGRQSRLLQKVWVCFFQKGSENPT